MYTGLKTLMYLTGLETAALVSGIVGGASALGSGIASAAGGSAMSKRKDVADIAKLNARLQKDLMNHQNSLQVANYERELAEQYRYDAYNYKNYNSLEAQVKDAKNAGLAPEVVAGGASSGGVGGSTGSIGGVSIPGTSVDAVGYANAKEQERVRKIESINKAINAVGEIIPKFEQLAHDSAARENQRELWKKEQILMDQQIQERALELTRKAFGNSKLQERYNREVLGFDFQKQSWKRQEEAHYMQMSLNRAQYMGMIQDQNQSRYRFYSDMNKDFLASMLTDEELTERRWRNQYMRKYGKYPEKSMSLADAVTDALRGMSGDASDSKNFVDSLKDRYTDSDGSFAYMRAGGDFVKYVLPWVFPYGKAFGALGKGLSWLVKTRRASKALPGALRYRPYNEAWDLPYTFVD